MSHHIYQTEALVLKSRSRGEANKNYLLFTKELGLILAIAQGVRHLRSKLRYSIDELKFVSVSVVRGRESWRLVGARELTPYTELTKDSSKMKVVARVAALLERLIQGEERNDRLFGLIVNMIDYLLVNEANSSVELLAVSRILYQSGYLTVDTDLLPLVNSVDWNLGAVDLTQKNRAPLKAAIEEAFENAHL
jgi:DNA repair protein RecO